MENEIRMTKERLTEYYNIKREAEDLRKRIEKLEKQSEMVGDVVQKGINGKAVIYGVDIRRAYKLEKYKNKLKAFNEKIIEEKIKIEEYIETIPFSEIRRIFRYRYEDGDNWIQIMHKMKYKEESTARKKHDKYLKNL